MAKTEVLKLANVKKHYMLGQYRLDVLKGIDFLLEKGEFVSIMGPSGSGKSTLLHILGLLDVPSSGSIRIDGHEASRLAEDDLAALRGQKIGFVFQFFYLISTMSALDNVALPMMLSGKSEEHRHARAKELLEKVGLGNRVNHKPSEMSGGERQRVAIARALANSPSLLLADEPTGNLDSKSGNEIMKIFQGLHEDDGMSLVTVTHDENIAKHSEKVVRIRDGVVEKVEKVHQRMRIK